MKLTDREKWIWHEASYSAGLDIETAEDRFKAFEGSGIIDDAPSPEPCPDCAEMKQRMEEAEADAIEQATIVGRLGEQVDSLTGKLQRAEAKVEAMSGSTHWCPECADHSKTMARLRELWTLANCDDKETWEKALDEINELIGE